LFRLAAETSRLGRHGDRSLIGDIRATRAIRASDVPLPWPAQALAKAAILQLFPNFPRHLFPDFLQYISEPPEMTSHDEEPKKAKTTKEN